VNKDKYIQYFRPIKAPTCRAADIILAIEKLECGPMPNVMAALCSTPQSLADAHY